MPLKQFNKRGNPSNTDTLNSGIQFYSAAIFTVDEKGVIQRTEDGRFLLNPSSYEEGKQSNWNPQTTPGQSDPPLQWTSGGPRTVSFDALVTRDTSEFNSGVVNLEGTQTSTQDKLLQKIGDIAAAFFKVTLPAPRNVPLQVQESDSLDISRRLNFYRSLLYPTYDPSRRKLRHSPPLVVLFVGKSIPKIAYGKKITTNHDVWVVTDLRIKITKQLPNLAPMEAIVSFQLMQYNIASFSRDRFR